MKATGLATRLPCYFTGNSASRSDVDCFCSSDMNPAGHPSLNGAAATVLLQYFPDDQVFRLTTAGQPDRVYTSIARARSDGNNGRIWGGMHFPSTIAISDREGEAIARYVNATSMQRIHGRTRR